MTGVHPAAPASHTVTHLEDMEKAFDELKLMSVWEEGGVGETPTTALAVPSGACDLTARAHGITGRISDTSDVGS